MFVNSNYLPHSEEYIYCISLLLKHNLCFCFTSSVNELKLVKLSSLNKINGTRFPTLGLSVGFLSSLAVTFILSYLKITFFSSASFSPPAVSIFLLTQLSHLFPAENSFFRFLFTLSLSNSFLLSVVPLN